MANFNKVLLIGNLTRDVEVRSTQSGMQVAKFGMAVNRKWTQDGQQKESTCFVDLTAFGRTGELLSQYVRKGSPLFVEGRLEYSTWQDKDGNKRNKLEVVVENFQFLGGGQARGEFSGRGEGPARAEGSRGEGPGRKPAQADAGAGGEDSGGGSGGSEAAPGGDYGEIPF